MFLGFRWMALARRFELFLVILFPFSTHCKIYFIPLTSRQWTSTWMLRTGHITLSAVPTNTEHRILYGYLTCPCQWSWRPTSASPPRCCPVWRPWPWWTPWSPAGRSSQSQSYETSVRQRPEHCRWAEPSERDRSPNAHHHNSTKNDKDNLGIKSYDCFLAEAAPGALQAETTEPLLGGNCR